MICLYSSVQKYMGLVLALAMLFPSSCFVTSFLLCNALMLWGFSAQGSAEHAQHSMHSATELSSAIGFIGFMYFPLGRAHEHLTKSHDQVWDIRNSRCNPNWPSSDVIDYFNMAQLSNKCCESLVNGKKLYWWCFRRATRTKLKHRVVLFEVWWQYSNGFAAYKQKPQTEQAFEVQSFQILTSRLKKAVNARKSHERLLHSEKSAIWPVQPALENIYFFN